MKDMRANSIAAIFGLAACSMAGGAFAASYNINFAGSEELGIVEVADGTVIGAPSTGTNVWNNISVVTGDAWDPDPAVALLNTSGVDEGVTIDNSGPFTEDLRASAGTSGVSGLFEGYFGFGNFDATVNVDGLDSGAVYDVYVYLTWRWSEDEVDFALTHSGGTDTLELTPQQSTAQNENAVQGDGANGSGNYVVFSGVSPTGDGSFDVRAFNVADGGFSGIQIYEVPEPSVALLGALGVLGLLRRRR